MAGWLHGVFVGDRLFVFPLCGFSLSLFCNYTTGWLRLLSTTGTRAVSVQRLDVLLLDTVNA